MTASFSLFSIFFFHQTCLHFETLYFLQPSAPGDPPTNVTAMATHPVSILIRWGRVPCINRNSIIMGYTVRYSTGGGSTVNVSVSGTGYSERTYTATLLEPFTSYFIQVAAVTNTGVTGPFSTIVNETSPPRSESFLKNMLAEKMCA